MSVSPARPPQCERPFHDIDDPRVFVERALNDELRSRGGSRRETPVATWDDAVSDLLLELWLLGRRYDPDQTDSFRVYAYPIIRHRFTDFLRRRGGDARYGWRVRELDDGFEAIAWVDGRAQVIGHFTSHAEAVQAAKEHRTRPGEPIDDEAEQRSDHRDYSNEVMSNVALGAIDL